MKKCALIAGMLFFPIAAFAQSTGTVSLPSGYQVNTPATVSAAINAAFQAKADANNGVLNSPTITGGRISGAPISSSSLFSMQSPTATPSSVCSAGSYSAAFSCDLSHLNYAIGTNITGVATLGEPTTGYTIIPNLSAQYIYYSNSSGWNQSVSGNSGRTGAEAVTVGINSLGQGDTTAFFVTGAASGTLSGATNFLAEPAVEMFNGQLSVGANGDYMEGIGDINLADDGYDAAGIGFVTNLDRTVNTAALGETWLGSRIQSIGSKNLDAFFSGSGPSTIGLDLSGMTGGTVGIALPRGVGVYGNATNTGPFPIVSTFASGSDEIVDATGGWQVTGGLSAPGNDALLYQNTSAQSIPNATATTVTGWTKTFDRLNANFSASTGTFTAPATGYYQVGGQIVFALATGVVNAAFQADVIANGVAVAEGKFDEESVSAVSASVQIPETVVSLSAGQTIVIQAVQNSGAALALSTASAQTTVSINRLP